MEKTTVSKLKIIESYYETIASRGIDEYLDYLQCMTRGNLYRYNLNNQILIYKQNPQAELVATYDVWKQQGYVLRKHSAIHADRNDRMTGLDYVFEAGDVIGLNPEKKEGYIWKAEESDYDFLNHFFTDKRKNFAESVMWASNQCFSKLDILKEDEAARRLAESAANFMILGRCGIFYPFEEFVKNKFNERTADERKQIIKKIQPYVSQFSGMILGNIGLMVKKNKKKQKEAEQIIEDGGKNGTREEKTRQYHEKFSDRAGNRSVYEGGYRTGNCGDSGAGKSGGGNLAAGTIEAGERTKWEEKSLTEEEKQFLETDSAPLIVKKFLAWDEIEALGYRFFENGYIDKSKPEEKSLYGNGLVSDSKIYDIARRMQGGEDIREELAKALIGSSRQITGAGKDDIAVVFGDDAVITTFGNVRKQISYEEMGTAFLSLFEHEYRDIEQARIAEEQEWARQEVAAQKKPVQPQPERMKKAEAKIKNKLEDFGEKIGGAKKDLWKKRGVSLEDIIDMDVVDRETYINKDYVWAKPNYQELKDSGIPVEVVYFYKKMRDSIPKEPPIKTEKKQTLYVSFVSELKEAVMSCQKPEDTEGFLKKFLIHKGYLVNKGYCVVYENSDYMGIITNKMVKAAQTSHMQLQREVKQKQFLYSQEEKILDNYHIIKFDDRHIWVEKDKEANGASEKSSILKRKDLYGFQYIYPKGAFADRELWQKDTWYVLKKNGEVAGINFPDEESAKNFALNDGKSKIQEKESTKKTARKKKLVPKALETIERTGLPDVCGGKDVTAEDFMGRFGVKGGEFGNWLSKTEKQTNLNMAYEAFSDLALALDVDEKDISLNGRLSIAFGARGSGNALAHYEPAVQVINLTRMKGAGSLSHEWGHALDDITKRICQGVPIEMTELIESLKFQTEPSGLKTETNFYQEAKHLDRLYSKCDKGYWSSNEELFARAFACYVKDKLIEKGGRSDYLNGHADSVEVLDSDGIDILSGFPKGREREQINEKFDFLIEQYKKRGILHTPEQAPIIAHVR